MKYNITNVEKLCEFVKVYCNFENITEQDGKIIVDGYLDLEGTPITSLPDNLTVGGYLDLRGTSITSLPDNLTVGRNLYLEGTPITNTSLERMKVKSLNEGYCEKRKYIYFDGILWGNVKSVKRLENKTIYKTPLGYCVVEEKLSAHGKILKEAMEDLTFKKIKNMDVSKIAKEIKKSGKVNRMQYRAITGACQFGTEQFCIKNNIQDLEEIDLEKLRKILINDYGAEKFWQLIDKED